jgi:Ni/Co efflux regulator RcnB
MMPGALIGILIMGLVWAPAALAEKGGHGHQQQPRAQASGRDRSADHAATRGRSDREHAGYKGSNNKELREERVVAHEYSGGPGLSARQRDAIHEYYVTHYGARGHCPPGLARKNHACLPPGQAKKHWALHRPLPEHLVVEPLPPGLATRLDRPPPGHAWGYLDGDILLYALVGRVVVDAVSALVD